MAIIGEYFETQRFSRLCRMLGEASGQLTSDLKRLAQREAVKASAFSSTLRAALKTDMRHAAQLFTREEPVAPSVQH